MTFNFFYKASKISTHLSYNNIAANVGEVGHMMEFVWWSNQGARSYNVWTYTFSWVSTSSQAYSLLSETICQCCAHTSSAAVVSGDAFQIMTDCWHARTHAQTLAHNHTTANSDPFLCHTCTLIFTHVLRPTQAHTQTPMSGCANGGGKCGAHFQGAHRVLKEKSISNAADLIDSERRAEPTVVFCLLASDTIAPTSNRLA